MMKFGAHTLIIDEKKKKNFKQLTKTWALIMYNIFVTISQQNKIFVKQCFIQMEEVKINFSVFLLIYINKFLNSFSDY